jgi:sterol desaturase/sphingolipid hydroxylase (fatty acid hydroxylase superfamily)
VIARVIAAAISLALLAAMFVPLERLFPRRKQAILRPRAGVDLAFLLGQYLVWSALSLAILAAVRGALDGARLAAMRDAFQRWPFAAQAVTAVIAGDLLVYGWHRACHASPLLWRFHAIHHSARHLDWLAAHREHPLDGITTQLAQNLPAFVLGFPLGTIAALATLRGAWGVFIHSNARLPLGPLGLLLGAPELHHYHHARGREARNFANLAPWIDLVFGTHHRPAADDDYPLGLDEPMPEGYLAQLVFPFHGVRQNAAAQPPPVPARMVSTGAGRGTSGA